MKRIVLIALVAVIVVSCAAPVHAVSDHASAAIVMDGDSGRVLYGHNIHEERLIASITKLMTALVAVEQTEDLDREITIRREWLGSEGSSIYLREGERISMRGLLYGLLLQSGNDAAMAIACHLAGDEDAFAALMNRRARELGMVHSSFANPSGLNEEGHYSSAYDMALLARACLNNEIVAEICATQCARVGERTFYNHNKLLHRYEGCVGMKTGYTERAGRTLVSAARRNGQTLICVTLNDGDDWNDHEKLLDYGFQNWPEQQLCKQGDAFGAISVKGSLITGLPIMAEQDCAYPLQEGERPEMTVELAHALQAPVTAGMSVGWVSWSLNGDTIARTELICAGGANDDRNFRESIWKRITGRWKHD